MKKLKLLLIVLTLNSLNIYSQRILHQTATGKYKLDERPQIQKEHEEANLNDISVLDLVDILKFQGIEINKFKLGTFDKKYKLYIIKEEYLNGQIFSSDTIVDLGNSYNYYESEKQYYDFIDQITIITKDIPEEKKSQFLIKTYAMSINSVIEMKNMEKENTLHWRKYTDTKWELNKKIPLLVYASTWLDKKHNIRRFCGVNYLKENDKGTNELLNNSPNYMKISYLVTE